MKTMPRKLKRALFVLALLLVFAPICYIFFPFGIPKPAVPNCGPEHRLRLGIHFRSKSDVLVYLQEHELELLSGSSTPRLGGFPAGSTVGRMDVVIDWQSISDDIKIERRLVYTVYTLTYHHPACSENQHYTFKVTSYGLASLYGCCGV